jgi:SNF2 family DNA or RNA helicase
MEYSFRTTPFAHQLEAFHLSKLRPTFALFMEQGTGKTKVIIDNAAYLYEAGQVNALLVVADNGIHRNWINDELPVHLPERTPHRTFIWESKRANTKRYQQAWDAFLREPDALLIFAINIDAVITKNGAAAVSAFLEARTCMMVVDESTSIKTPGAKRTRACIRFGAKARFRRICTGTPVAESPFNAYSQFAFLSRNIIGINSYYAFKQEYGVWRQQQRTDGQYYPVLVQYRNLNLLTDRIQPYMYRKLKKECLDLPEKLWQKRYFDLAASQRQLYDTLRDQSILQLSQQRGVVVPLVMTKILRLQQIACGYIPSEEHLLGTEDGDTPATALLADNARLDALMAQLEELPATTQVIIWARFTKDIDLIMERLGHAAVRYDGMVSDDARESAKQRFQQGLARYFVANPKAGGKGLTLTAASVVIFYSNYYGLETRQQAEDRAHRIGQRNPVTYIDLIAVDTVDERIVRALRDKKKLADLITGDQPGDWL